MEKLLSNISKNTEFIGPRNFIIDSYNYIKNSILDNIVIIFIIYIIIVPYLIKKEYRVISIVLIIVAVFTIYYLLKRFYSNFIYTKSRANDCLELISTIIINKTIKPIEVRKELLEKPFNEFLIFSSHNTYIPCTQNIDISSVESIKRALAMGARVIELDCFAKNNIGKSNDDMIPVITHGIERGEKNDIFTTSSILFEDCIDTIANYGFLTSDPLIICLELNTNNLIETQKKMKEIIIKKMGKYLLSNEYKIGNKTNRKYFSNEPIKNLLNKVIFVSGNGDTSELQGIIDGKFGEPTLNNSNHTDPKFDKKNEKGVLHRVYPDGNIGGHLSFNFDPIKYWKNGYQIVALNLQTLDDNMIKNIGFFKNHSYVHMSEL
jgi:hypothetical protein